MREIFFVGYTSCMGSSFPRIPTEWFLRFGAIKLELERCYQSTAHIKTCYVALTLYYGAFYADLASYYVGYYRSKFWRILWCKGRGPIYSNITSPTFAGVDRFWVYKLHGARMHLSDTWGIVPPESNIGRLAIYVSYLRNIIITYFIVSLNN